MATALQNVPHPHSGTAMLAVKMRREKFIRIFANGGEPRVAKSTICGEIGQHRIQSEPFELNVEHAIDSIGDGTKIGGREDIPAQRCIANQCLSDTPKALQRLL